MSNKIFKGLSWSFADNIFQQIVNFIVGIILARLLTPSEFGVLGIITVFVSICTLFIDSGLSEALINKKNANGADYHTVFWANVLFGAFIYLVLFFTAPLIALFFNIPELTFLIRLTGVNIILISFSAIQRTIYVKELKFHLITIVSTISVVISGTIAIIMAYQGYGVISLIWRILIGQVVTLILFYIISSWRPKFIFNMNSFKSMYSYGINLFGSRMLNTIYNNIYSFIIGKFFGQEQLGYYSRAHTFQALVSTNISNTVQRVSFSALSKLSDKESQRNMFEKFQDGTMIIVAFMMTFLFLSAEPIILILLGEKWINSISYLQLLAIAGLFLPIYNLNLNYLAVQNKTKTHFKIEIITKLLVIPFIYFGIVSGSMHTLLLLMVGHTIIAYFISILTLSNLSLYKFSKQIVMMMKLLMLAGVGIVCYSAVDYLSLTNNNYILLIMSIAILIIVFGIGSLFLFPKLLKKFIK